MIADNRRSHKRHPLFRAAARLACAGLIGLTANIAGAEAHARHAAKHAARHLLGKPASDLACLENAIAGEAPTQTPAEQATVANSAKRRAALEHRSICAVVHESYRPVPYRHLKKKLRASIEKEARNVLTGGATDVPEAYRNALYFCDQKHSMPKNKYRPLPPLTRHGLHNKFYVLTDPHDIRYIPEAERREVEVIYRLKFQRHPRESGDPDGLAS